MRKNSLFVLLIGFVCSTYAHSLQNVWDVLREEFQLNHEITQADVQTQIRWLISHPGYLHQLAGSEPYIYHIVTEIKKRHLPGELALIPMIESSFDPFAYSNAGAAGLWQLMPNTGKDLGLKQDWWYDGRRSIGASTHAALNYLHYLHNYFKGNWLLAIAAYDAGEGALTRIIQRTYPHAASVNFWSLPVPHETKTYVPRLLALAEIVQNPQRYHIILPYIPHAPYFEEVNIDRQIDLNHAAKLAGISYHELIKLNPGFNRWMSAPHQGFKLLLPTSHVASFTQNLSVSPTLPQNNWKTDLPVIPLQKPSHFIATQPYKLIHIVQPNDTLDKICKKYHVSLQQVRHWNHLSKQPALFPGEQLTLWRTG